MDGDARTVDVEDLLARSGLARLNMLSTAPEIASAIEALAEMAVQLRAASREQLVAEAAECLRAHKVVGGPKMLRAAVADANRRAKRINGHAAQAEHGPLTELVMSERLVDRFGSDLRHCATLGGWHVWTDTHWAPDVRESARERAKDIARELARHAADSMDARLFHAAKDAGKAKGVAAILSLARSVPGVVFGADDSNRDPWLLNCTNGTVDLRTAGLRAHDRGDLITRCTGIAYDPNASCPIFERFLTEVQPDPEVRAYLARLLGYAAVGIVREHVLGVFYGPGANGKSVFAEIMMHVFGDYARPGPASLITRTGDHEPHPTDVASCVGARLVVVHETRRGAAFDASKVKVLTGGDLLTARFMRQDFFAFAPSHTLLMLSNYKPRADASDAALWRRMQLVLFGVVIPEEKRDPQLAERIKAHEAPGVLALLVRGALEWQRIGLAPPAAVREQTNAYRAAEDSIAQFLAERCTRLPGVRVRAGELYDAFKDWCSANNINPVRGNDFADEILGRGFERREDKRGRWYFGLGLTTEDHEHG